MLTAARVQDVFARCLFDHGEDSTDMVEAEGVTMKVGFHPGRLRDATPEIAEMLSELPDGFSVGGGWSFLQACETRGGAHWGEHRDVECLVLLGLAVGRVKYCLPRSMWSVLPGGMPYFSVQA